VELLVRDGRQGQDPPWPAALLATVVSMEREPKVP